MRLGYTEIVVTFSLNPFQSPLNKLLSEITPSTSENQRAQAAFATIRQLVVQLGTEQALPPIGSEAISLVGSHYRETSLSPLKHIDIFLQLDSSLVAIHEKGNTLNLVTKEAMLSTCVDESLHLLPQKLVNTLKDIFVKHYPTKISRTGQSLKLQLEKQNIEVRITPSFAWDHSFFVPLEHSELLWRKVSPYREKEMLTEINRAHKGNITRAIRLMKMWNEGRNNESFRNYHIEAIAYFIFEEIPTATQDVIDTLRLYVNNMSRYIYNCPDPTGLDTPIHAYLHDNIDKWYLFMNRIGELKTAVQAGEKTLADFLRKGKIQA